MRSDPLPRAAWSLGPVPICLMVFAGGILHAAEPLADRRTRVESMTTTQKAALRRAEERFNALESDEQEQLRRLDRELDKNPKADDLRTVMELYYEWIKTLSPSERDELRDLPPKERLARVLELREQQKAQGRDKRSGFSAGRGRPFGDRFRKLAEEERPGLERWIDTYVARGAPSMIDDLPESGEQDEFRRRFDEVRGDSARGRQVFAQLWLRWQVAHQNPFRPLPLDENELETLWSNLSPRARESFAERPPEHQRGIINQVLRITLFHHFQEPFIEFLRDELPEEELRRLANLPRDVLLQRLWGSYVRSKIPRDGPGPFGGPGRRGPGGFGGSRGGPGRHRPDQRGLGPHRPGPHGSNPPRGMRNPRTEPGRRPDAPPPPPTPPGTR